MAPMAWPAATVGGRQDQGSRSPAGAAGGHVPKIQTQHGLKSIRGYKDLWEILGGGVTLARVGDRPVGVLEV